MLFKLTLATALTIFTFSVSAQKIVTQKSNEQQETSVDTIKKNGHPLLEVKIIGPARPTQIGRAEIAPMDLPQSVQVVSGETIKQQQPLRLSEVVRNINGVYVSSARGGAQESFFARGYDMSANNMYKNGFRVSSGSMPEVASLERVEVLKGGAALLYGNVAPGGILNLVTKTPLFTHGGSVEFQAGSYSFFKPVVDFYGPLSEAVAYRFVGTYENSESFRDIVDRQRVYVNPSLTIKASKNTEIIVQADYLYDDWTPDFGTGTVNNKVSGISREKYLGALWSNGLTKQTSVSALVSHKFRKNWKLDFNSSFQDYDRISKGTERIQPDEAGIWKRPLGQNKATELIAAEQLSVQGIFKTGKVKHQLMTGLDFENAIAKSFTYAFDGGQIYDTVNIFSFFNEPQRTDIPFSTNTKTVETETNRFGVYFQDLISVTEKFKVLAGLRWSWQEASPTTFDKVKNESDEGSKKLDRAFSPKVGIVYQPLNSLSLFASYSNSFTPNTGVTINEEPLDASIIDQYEVGVKKEFLERTITANITAYHIINSNLAQIAEFTANGLPNSAANIKTLSGETTSKGFEIDITAKPMKNLSVLAGYSYNDMRFTNTNGLKGSFIEGDRLVRTPQNTANLSFFYTFAIGNADGFSFGAIGNYIGKRIAGWNNTVGQTMAEREIPLSDYTTIDLSAGYSWKKLSLLCRLSNVGNVLNYTVHENYSVNPTAPRQVLTSLRYTF